MIPPDMPFAFCTRDKDRWCELAESAETGSSIEFLRQVFKRITSINQYHISRSSIQF